MSSGEDDCTYNPTAAYNKTAYQISVGQYKYCSSTVYEEHGYNTPTFLRITGYYTGRYYGIWSPDNYYGY